GRAARSFLFGGSRLAPDSSDILWIVLMDSRSNLSAPFSFESHVPPILTCGSVACPRHLRTVSKLS
ncbi:MAG: hypothetical protein K2Z81_16380, partial [Cyanobacteria bacterium]|nr:hypothetical protein [Cyanobacteriota bacterium]